MYDDFAELMRVAKELEAAGVRALLSADKIVKAYGYAVQAQAQQFAPVDTGTLRSSISVQFVGGFLRGVVTAIIGPEVEYGGYVEFGTSVMPPHAYLGPALDRIAPAYVAAIEAIANPFGGVGPGVTNGGSL